MFDFFKAVVNPDIAFLRYALIAGLLSSISFGIIGTYVVVRRISYLAGAVSHCVLAGIGAALYFDSQTHCGFCHPMAGAVISAVSAALIIGLISIYAKEREDTIIGAVWAVGMALGLIFIAKTPGYIDPMSYLFGNILLLSQSDILLIAGLDLMVIAVGVLFYNKYLALCFDEEFALLRGVRTKVYYLLLLCLTALTVVLLVRVVGIVMVIALITLPAGVAGMIAKKLRQMMIFAVLLCMLFTSSGIAVSYMYDLPTGPVIILLAGIVYFLVILSGSVKSLVRRKTEIR